MALIVQKFGGSSVGTLEKIQGVAEKVIQEKKQGNDVVVVLSAMQGDTDKLIQMAKDISPNPSPREYDALVSIGEQVSTALLSMALHARGYEASSFSGGQAGIKTDSTFKKARIVDIDTNQLSEAITNSIIPVVAGFQGVDKNGNVNTLGRGGSDTSAVALAASMKADECHIYTDVAGVYTTDPRVVPSARLLKHITFEEMLELSSLGAKVLQIRAVEFAGKYNVKLRVLSTFEEGNGTLITYEDDNMEQAKVSGIAFDRNQAKLSILGVPNQPGNASHILGAVSDDDIDVDMIVQNVPSDDGNIDFSFTVYRDDYERTKELLEKIAEKLKAKAVIGDNKIAKLSLVGVGMKSHAGVATTMFDALGKEGINIDLISTSEIKISVVIDEKYIELGARTLHAAFGLAVSSKEDYN